MPDPNASLQIASLLFPNVRETPADFFRRYPPRDLPPGAIVTRFAPSPTGFIHIGSIYISLIGRRLTAQSGGIWMLRIEDTDQQREIERGVEQIVESIAAFGFHPDEGPYAVDPLRERGAYGPYKQSQRKAIYAAFARYLVEKGLAYPSFQTTAELDEIRAEQEQTGSKTGYYGPWARDRAITPEEVQRSLAEGKPFVIRIRAPYPAQKTICIQDAIRGRLEMPENDQDYVLLKSDGLPTYHLAHAVDDPLMRVNLVLRADEWLSTLPLHVQLFEAFGQPLIDYAHIAPIGKLDGNSKRKLSKRKDPEAAVAYYYQKGYPRQAILEYILNIANSSFEDWRRENPAAALDDFDLKLERMSNSIAMYDPLKMDSVSKDVIAQYSAAGVYEQALDWARQYDPPLAEALAADPAYSRRVFALNSSMFGQTQRKDLACWSDVRRAYGFFFDPLYEESVKGGYNMPAVDPREIPVILDGCIASLDGMQDKETWLGNLRAFGESIGYTTDRKAYKADPARFKGVFGNLMMALRVALTNQQQTPDLYDSILIMGKERAARRLAEAKARLS